MTHLVEEIINPALLLEIAGSTQQGFLYAIIDCAFDLGIRKPLRKWSSVPLYQATELADLAPYSPELYLVDEKQQPQNIEQLIALCKGQPMLSFIRSPLELMPLKEHLEYLLKVYCEDNTEWPLRYADTRILIPLFEVLTEEQKKILLGPLEHWFIPDRFGMIQDITGENQPDKKWQAAMGSLKMDEIQFTAMVDAAMPDSILST
ncbi:MAG: DUF4123 domain-containing protein, partial [Iodobacter sp.]